VKHQISLANSLPPELAARVCELLADPSPQDWRRLCAALDELHRAGSPHLRAAADLTRKRINLWPAAARQAVPRDPLDHWRRSSGQSDSAPSHDLLLDLCLRVKHESQTYSYYETYVANDDLLLWREAGPWGEAGAQQVHLARAFSGSVRALKSNAWLRIGEPGQGDLVGWLSVLLPPYGLLAIKLELEVKMPEGRLSKSQRARRDELARAGGIYLSAKSVRSAVTQIVAVRDVLITRGSVGDAVRVVEERAIGWAA
jgi:hypothetical protein